MNRRTGWKLSLPQRTELARLLADRSATVTARHHALFAKRGWVNLFGKLTPLGEVNAETARRSFEAR
jgi:hypothetical protein